MLKYLSNLALLLLLPPLTVLSNTSVGNSDNSLVFASDYWQGYVEADGQGLIKDLLVKIYEPHGYSITMKIMPMLRTALAITKGQADATVGIYSNKVMKDLPFKSNFSTPLTPISTTKATLLCHVKTLNSSIPWREVINSSEISYGWARSYFYSETIGIVQKTITTNTDTGIKMLLAGRLDCFISSKREINRVIKNDKIVMTQITRQIIDQKNLYLGFRSTQKGQKLITIFDNTMKDLIDSGDIFSIYSKWGEDYQKIINESYIQE